MRNIERVRAVRQFETETVVAQYAERPVSRRRYHYRRCCLDHEVIDDCSGRGAGKRVVVAEVARGVGAQVVDDRRVLKRRAVLLPGIGDNALGRRKTVNRHVRLVVGHLELGGILVESDACRRTGAARPSGIVESEVGPRCAERVVRDHRYVIPHRRSFRQQCYRFLRHAVGNVFMLLGIFRRILVRDRHAVGANNRKVFFLSRVGVEPETRVQGAGRIVSVLARRKHDEITTCFDRHVGDTPLHQVRIVVG